MKALTEARYRGRDGIWAVFDLSWNTQVRVGILEHDIGRVVMRRDGGYRLDRGWSIAPGGLEPSFEGRLRDSTEGFSCPEASVLEQDGTIRLESAGLTAVVSLSPFGIAWHRPGENGPFLQDRTTQAYLVSRKTGALQHFMARHEKERHYGVGDKAGPLDHTGRRFKIDAVDPCGFDAELSDPLYKMIPFVLVDGPAGAHGIFYDNLAVGEMDLGCTIDNYHGLFRSYSAQSGDLDFYVLAGPGVPDVVRRFSWLTGGQAFAPKWSLGFATTSMTIADAPDADARITDYIEKCRHYRIPCDSFHFGSGYTSIGHRRYAFNWNREKFPDPAATMARLKEAGMQPVTNLKPCLLDDHPRLDEAKEQNVLVMDSQNGQPAVAQFWDGLGFHVDFTSPQGRNWWRNGIQTALLDYGVTSVWNDNNEYEIWDEDAVCAGDGHPFPQVLARAAQPLLMTKLSFEAQAAHAPGKRPYAITRGGAAGIWRYAQTWSGDNETSWKSLRFNLTQGLNMSLSGMYNIGHDVGGFHGPSPNPELFCRFVEFCSLWPRFVMNSWKDNGVVNLPWMHENVISEVRDAITLRYRLMPYIYTQLWRASHENEPMVRPLFYDFLNDLSALDVQDSFMLGPDILVAPVLEEGATNRKVYLPEHSGGWFDFHDGRQFEGGRTITIEAPLGRLPIFVRCGAMIPLTRQTDGIDPRTDALRELIVFGAPHDGSEAYLYEDNGDTSDWNGDSRLEIRFQLRRSGKGLELFHTFAGSYRPAFDSVTVRPVAIEGQIRIQETSEAIKVMQGTSAFQG
ncbi:glycoside hydrolase family 31 protein [Microvirga rosea]|uniref:glycoside hydrolase family 31 protein n=1 Tax=Microvirga rosea TaxID=2715425 RepID=UPI001D09E800|nr:glycoside hydrolase family 31 protein [Microvirga rosea]MCB8822037.1 glycoside hydrolase family 31 protein [Microvirga rosea]